MIGHQKIGDNAVQKTNLTPEPQWTFGVKISLIPIIFFRQVGTQAKFGLT